MELERAIQLKPNYATAHHWLAFTLMILARFDRAIAEQKRAIELDPLSLIINTDLSWIYLNARRYDDAEAQARKALEVDSRFFRAHYRLGAALQLQNHIAKAILEYQKAIEVNDDPYSVAVLGQAYARNGQVDEARKILARLNEEAKSRYVPPYGLALIQLALDNKQSALDDLERGYQEGSASYMYLIKVDPFLDDLRGQPRFEALVQKITGEKQ
jgi:tetratricopeptide (TPR) repeat protein